MASTGAAIAGWTRRRCGNSIDALFDLFRAGRLDPVAGATLPLDDLAQGYAMLRERRSVGKVVITL